MECRHLDGNPENNHVGNLQWGTHLDNAQDMIRHGKTYRGSRHHNAKLSEADVVKIKQSSEPSRVLGQRFGVTAENVRAIRRGITWSHVHVEA